MENLIDILPEKFRSGPTRAAEEYFLDKAQKGEPAVFTTGDEKKDDPANAADWGEDRTIRSELIYWLCMDKAAIELVHAKGIQIGGAKIADPLDLECVDIPHRLILLGCALDKVTLRDASARMLGFDGSVIGVFNAHGLKTSGGLSMENVKATGEVRFFGAEIGGDLDCAGAELNNPGGNALFADGLRVKGSVILRYGFKAAGAVRLIGAEIGGGLECEDAEFDNPKGYALCADRIKVKGSVFLINGFKASGAVRLLGAAIGGDLECDGAEFNNPNDYALVADGVKVKGNVFLRNEFKAVGEVRLLDAEIGGSLACIGAEFDNPKGYTLNADRIKVKGNVLLSKVKANGEVRLPGADIGGQLNCEGAEFKNPNGYALICQDARIKGGLFLDELKGLVGALSLVHTKAGRLVDDEKSWPEMGTLYIDGFEYGGLPGVTTPKSATERLKWLRLQPTKPFRPRPYEQLAKVFREMGHDSDARKVLMAKQEDLRKHGKLSRKAKAWNWFLGQTIGHGYETWRAVIVLIVFLMLGWGVFNCAYGKELIACSKECSTGNTFNPFMYSLDVLLPVINFHQKDYYSPNASTLAGEIVRWYFWIHIAVGWVFTTLAVASLTGLVRKGKE